MREGGNPRFKLRKRMAIRYTLAVHLLITGIRGAVSLPGSKAFSWIHSPVHVLKRVLKSELSPLSLSLSPSRASTFIEQERMSQFRAATTSSTLPSIVLLALSALNLAVVFHYWRVQRSTLPADHYSLYCKSHSSASSSVRL